MSERDKTEEQILAKGLDAPRVRLADIEAKIMSEHYFTASAAAISTGATYKVQDGFKIDRCLESLSLLTICVMVLENGFTVLGKSACASPENFDAALGQILAREDAIKQVWPLEGYLLRQALWLRERQA